MAAVGAQQYIPGTVGLLSGQEIADLNRRLADLYAESLDRHFRGAADSEMRYRIRAYDNHQRFTLGRAQSALLQLSTLATSGIDFADLKQRHDNGPDRSFFLEWDDNHHIYESLLDAVRYTVQTLLPDYTENEGLAMVTVFCHRVLVRPQEHYKGFFHRDLAPRSGKIGTIVWYPTIRHELVSGLDLVAYAAKPDVTLKTLYGQTPDYQFTPSVYAGKALVLGYPHNYAHGVRAGVNHAVRTTDVKPSLQDFVLPDGEDFIKDLVIITISERSPVED